MNEQIMLHRRADVMTADMNGSTVMMDIEAGKYYNLGEVGGRIWAILKEPITLGILVDRLTMEYNVDRAQCLRDVVPFLDCLTQRGLLTQEG